MRLSVQSLVVLALFALVSGATPRLIDSDIDHLNGREVAAGEILVRFRSGVDGLSELRRHGQFIEIHPVAQTGFYRVKSGTQRVSALLRYMRGRTDVVVVEPNYIIRAASNPNDKRFSAQTHLAKIQAPGAWDYTMGSRNVVVAVLDTGVDYNHPDLAANMWTAPSPFSVTVGATVNCAAGTRGFNVFTRTCDPMDDVDHGTSVAGIVGAVGNNGIGVTGVSPLVSMMAVKVLNRNRFGKVTDLIDGLEFIRTTKAAFSGSGGADVKIVNASLGLPLTLTSEINALETQLNTMTDMLIVAAAGNDARSLDSSPQYPAAYNLNHVVTVAASTDADALSSYSNYSPTIVDIAAPGDFVVTTDLSTKYVGSYWTGSLTIFGSTSGTAPQVTGTAALVAAACPGLSVTGIRDAILNNADAVITTANRVAGNRRLNTLKALQSCASLPNSFLLTTTGSAVQTVAPLGSANYTVSVAALGTFNGTVNLSAVNVPAGITVDFSPTGISTSGTSTMTVTAGSGLAAGRYAIQINASDGTTTKTALVSFIVGAPSVTSVNPKAWTRGSSVTIAAFGAGLDNVTGVSFSGGITATIAESRENQVVLNVTIPGGTTTGNQTLTLTTAGGTSAPFNFEVLTTPVWGHGQKDAQRTARSTATGPTLPAKKWQFAVTGVPSTPVIGYDGVIYLPSTTGGTGTSGILYAINPDGTQRWATTLPLSQPKGTAPAIGIDGSILVHTSGTGSGSGYNGTVERLYSISRDGAVNWVYAFGNGDTLATSEQQSSPAVSSTGTIFTASMDRLMHVVSPIVGFGSTFAIGSTGSSFNRSAPAIGSGNDNLYIKTDPGIRAYNGTTGQQLYATDLGVIDANASSVAYGSTSAVYVVAGSTLHSMNGSGVSQWNVVLPATPLSSPALAADGTIYVGVGTSLLAINPNGTTKWTATIGAGAPQNSPVVDGGGTIYWANRAFNPADGSLKWTLPIGGGAFTELAPTPAIGSDGTLYVPTHETSPSTAYSLVAYTALTATSISQTTATQGDTFSSTITGTGLDTATAVTFSGSGVTATLTGGATSTSLPVSITVAAGAATGLRTFTVTGPGGTTPSVSGLTINAATPVISGISPASAVQSATASVNVNATISGNFLTGATAVTFSGTGVTASITSTTTTSTSVTVTITSTAITGARTFTVTGPGGTSAPFNGFTVLPPVPAITSIGQSTAVRSSSFATTVSGTGLTGATAVAFSGTGVTASINGGGTSTSIPITVTVGATARPGLRTLTATTSGGTSTPFSGLRIRQTPAFQTTDYDGDGITDLGTFLPSAGLFQIRRSTNGTLQSATLGVSTDRMLYGDYDGDGKTDIAVWTPSSGLWKRTLSGTGQSSNVEWGVSSDIPVPGDYDGDGKTDIAVWSPAGGVWHLVRSSDSQYVPKTLGASGNVPVPMDYDGDGKTDMAVWNAATFTWTTLTSASNFVTTTSVVFGASGDIPVPGDYDGDGTSDVATWKPSTGLWSATLSGGGTLSVTIGSSADEPAPGDYDGDGISDPAVFTASTGVWTVRQSSNGQNAQHSWGGVTQIPLTWRVRTAAATTNRRIVDTDGDAKTEIGIWRIVNNTFQFHILQSSNNAYRFNEWGGTGDLPALADYDGDGKTDIAIWRIINSKLQFHIFQSSNNAYRVVEWGGTGDEPAVADYDGDGKADIAIWRIINGTFQFHILQSSNNAYRFNEWGGTGDLPAVADYDGDGKADIAIWRIINSKLQFHILQSSNSAYRVTEWGGTGDMPAAGDYDGDGKWDVAIWRIINSKFQFHILQSSNNSYRFNEWGGTGDLPAVSDYDGDGKSDIAIWRIINGKLQFHILQSSNNAYRVVEWGGTGDLPMFPQ